MNLKRHWKNSWKYFRKPQHAGKRRDVQFIENRYLDKLYRYGKEESYHDCINDEDFKGTIKGISEEGLLLMEMPDKSVRRFAFKELSYII